jgi:20S proteasome subunit alpha 6
MRQQAMSSRMVFNRPIPVNRLVSAIADSPPLPPLPAPAARWRRGAEAQVNTQEYGRRPYGVGFLVVGHDQTGPHLYEFSPSGNSYEYYAMSIGARSQSAKTYLERHYESFADCALPRPSPLTLRWPGAGTLDELITHGLHALRETLQQDKDLTPANTSIGIVGPAGAQEAAAPPGGAFRILEGEPIAPYLATMTPKETGAAADAPPTDPAPAPAAGPAAGAADEDVQMEWVRSICD